jgi:hypothetical protein
VNVKVYIMVVAAAALAACPLALADTDPGDEAKEAAAEKKGEALKAERAAELEAMGELENVSATLAVAVKSCVMQAIEEPKKKGKEEESVDVGGDWGELAGSLFRAVEREMREGHEEVPPDTAKAGDGKVYVYLDVVVENRSEKTQLVLPGDFTLQTPEGYAVNYNVKTYGTVDPFDGIYLAPGASSGGKLVFVLPPRDTFTLHYYNPQTKAAGTKRVLVMRGD